MLLQKTLLALASCSLFSVAAFAQTPPSPYQNVAASSCNRDMVLRRSPSLVNTSATKRADIIGRQTVPAFRKATVKRRISSSITSTLISLGLLCRKKKEKAPSTAKNAVDIIEQSNYQFRQWNEASKNVADYNNPDAVKAAIPDGQLCSAGNVGAEWDERSKVWNDKSGLDAVTARRATDIQNQ